MQLNSFAELGKVAHSAQVIFIQSILLRICSFRIRKSLSEVGFEPTPTFVDQNALGHDNICLTIINTGCKKEFKINNYLIKKLQQTNKYVT